MIKIKEYELYNKCKRQSKFKKSYIYIKYDNGYDVKINQNRFEITMFKTCSDCKRQNKCKLYNKIRSCKTIDDLRKLDKHKITDLELNFLMLITNSIIAIGTVIGLFIK